MRKKYSIIPISFVDYNDYVEQMNSLKREGFDLVSMIREYKDSPEEGITTHDWVCCGWLETTKKG